MSWKGELIKAGIESDGKIIQAFLGAFDGKFGFKSTADEVAAGDAAGLKILAQQVSLADNASYNLPAEKEGVAIVWDGTDGGTASVSAAGACVVLAGSTNFVATDTDAKLCIFDGGTYATIKNASGGTLTVRSIFLYF